MNQESFDSTVSDFEILADQTLEKAARSHPYKDVSPDGVRNSINAYRTVLKKLYTTIENRHNKSASGKLVCALLSERIDRLVIHINKHFSPPGQQDELFAVAALGGYGRSELNPFSDVDILFLSLDPFDEFKNNIIKPMVHFLWDMKLDLGHSTRTVNECLEAARRDTYLATSLLEARFLAGSMKVWAEFRKKYVQWLSEGAGKGLAVQKIEERIRRLDYFHGTVHVQEPNVKESPGALRDIHTVRWLLLLTEPGGNLHDMFGSTMLSVSEKAILGDGLKFLLRVRNSLHFLTGGKMDVLNHESLPDVAVNLGYSGYGVSPVEEFMRDYYRCVGGIRRLTDLTVDEYVTRFMPCESSFLPVSENIVANETTVALEKKYTEKSHLKPRLLVELFAVAGARSANLMRNTSSIVEKFADKTGPRLNKNPGASSAFRDMMNMRKGISHGLRLMHDHGVLTKLIPEFETIHWHYQYDFYHAYTTDEHSLRVVENLEAISTGKNTVDPGLSVLMQEVTAKSALYLAGLLHDIGKSGGSGHVHRGERMAAKALKGLGFDNRTIKLVRFLICEHLLMSHTSQRRDIDDEDTINDFIERVGSSGRLRMLTLLTFADLMALSENALTEWKRALLWNLYNHALMLIDKRFEGAVHGSRGRRKSRIIQTLSPDFSRKVISSHLDNLPVQYIGVTTTAEVKRHICGIALIKKQGAWASFRRKGELTKLTIIAPDHTRALSDICGAITSSDISIVRAQIFTRNDGIIIDTFHVVGGWGEALIDSETQKEFKRNLPKIISGKIDVRHLILSHTRRWRRRKKNAVFYPTRVKVHNEISSKYTVIDVFATDYTGLLYDITGILSANGIDIHTARIGTDEDQVADAFYIQFDGKKIEDEVMIDKLTGEIIGRLKEAYR